MISLYIITYNEALILPYTLAFYRGRLPAAHITVFDNESSDATAEIAKAAGCAVITYSTNNQLSDRAYLEIKNNCWKKASTDWVMVLDADEHCDITERDLLQLEQEGINLPQFYGYNMVNLTDDLHIDGIRYGIRAPSYDKAYCFNKRDIREINYGPGAHSCTPLGVVKRSKTHYRCYHYKYINPQYMVQRHAHFAERLSAHNKQHGYGAHYQYSAGQIYNEFEAARKNARPLL